MAEKQHETAKQVLGTGAGAFAGTALALLLNPNKAQAAGDFALDEATRNAIIAIMLDAEKMDQVIADLQTIEGLLGGSSSSGEKRNAKTWKAIKVFVTPGTPIQLPCYPIPYRVKVGLIALTTNVGNIYVSPTSVEVAQNASRFTLVGGQAVNLEIDNTEMIWIDGDIAGECVQIAVEIRSV
jgi:hypothetical protein